MKYFKNTSWIFGEKILRMIVGLFVGIWVARYLDPEQFGLFSYAQSFVALFSAVATLGLDGIVVRELVQDKSRVDELIGTSFWLKFVGALAVFLLLLMVVQLTSNDKLTNSLIFIIASAMVFQSFNVIDMFFQAKVMSKYVVFVNIITLLMSSLIKIYLIIIEAPLIWFAWSVLFDSFVLACGFVYFYFKNALSIRRWKFKIEVAISLLKDSWPLILSSIVVTIYMKIDQVMIKEMLDVQAVGYYAAAVRLSEAWYFIPMVISSSLFPAIINAKKKSETLYYERLQRLYDLMVWMAIAIALPMTFLSDYVVYILYGEQYSQAASVLIIHIWAGVFVFLGVASGKWFIVENLQLLSFGRTFLGMIINLGLNFIFIPLYGINGAAIATLLSYSIPGVFFDFFNKKTKKMFFIKINTMNILRIIL